VPATTVNEAVTESGTASAADESVPGSSDKAKHVAEDADTDSDAGTVATDAQDAVKNIASTIGQDAGKQSEK
jgi:hypothetical protein